jgi:hypothetical protein
LPVVTCPTTVAFGAMKLFSPNFGDILFTGRMTGIKLISTKVAIQKINKFFCSSNFKYGA